jgi:hypothetical protein
LEFRDIAKRKFLCSKSGADDFVAKKEEIESEGILLDKQIDQGRLSCFTPLFRSAATAPVFPTAKLTNQNRNRRPKATLVQVPSHRRRHSVSAVLWVLPVFIPV